MQSQILQKFYTSTILRLIFIPHRLPVFRTKLQREFKIEIRTENNFSPTYLFTRTGILNLISFE